MLVLLLLLPVVLVTLAVLLCACRVGHLEDVQRGFAEEPAALP